MRPGRRRGAADDDYGEDEGLLTCCAPPGKEGNTSLIEESTTYCKSIAGCSAVTVLLVGFVFLLTPSYATRVRHALRAHMAHSKRAFMFYMPCAHCNFRQLTNDLT